MNPPDSEGTGAPSGSGGFHIAVPSRSRARGFYLQTYRKVIWRHGLEAETTVFVQTQEDLRAYTELLPRIRVILAPGEGLEAAQAAIADHYPLGSRVVVVHDDITRVVHLRDRRSKRFEDVRRLFEVSFAVMEKYGLTLGGLSPTDNALNESHGASKVTLGLRFIYDPLHFEIIDKRPLPLVTKLKHDVERSILHYRRSGGVLRLASYAVGTRHTAHAPGHYALEAADLQELRRVYPDEVHCFRERKGGYHSIILKALPHRGGVSDLEAQLYFDVLMGDYLVTPDTSTESGRLLELLQTRKWRINDQRTNIVEPRLRRTVRSKHGTETLRADAPIFSEGFREGEVFQACIQALPPELWRCFNFVTINRNLVCYPHRDLGNQGLSAILFLGRFEGGALVFESGERFQEPGRLYIFDGQTIHWNEPIQAGVKYSVVFYNRSSQRLRANSDRQTATVQADVACDLMSYHGLQICGV